MANFWRFLGPAFPASCVQYISDLRSKFALGPHHVYDVALDSMVDIQSAAAEIKRRKRKKKERKKQQGKNIMACAIP